LINKSAPLTKEEFKKFWEMIQADKQFTITFGGGEHSLYKGFNNMPGDITTCLENNGFGTMAQTTK